MNDVVHPARSTADPENYDAVVELVRDRGGRMTTCRRLILRSLFDSPGHQTADELATIIQAQIPEIHRSTVYRNLEELETLGVVIHSHLGHGAAAYHLASDLHGHFICEKCGAVIEAPAADFRSLARTAATEHGFTINPHHLAILGSCSDCQETSSSVVG